MQQYITASPEETMALAGRLAAQLSGGTTLAFTGAMGSGKTTFCRGLAAGLGVQDTVSSPTFAIAQLYRGPRPLAHFDAYRIQGPDDLAAAGYTDYLDAGAIVAVEWSERVREWLEAPLIHIDIRVLDDGRRSITIEGVSLPCP